MKIIIDTKKTIEQNAADYFERAKKIKKKIKGAEKIIREQEEKLEELKKIRNIEIEKEKKREEELKAKKERKKEKKWYEKFRWFFTTNNFLVIGGKDATSNEAIIKKYTDKEDLVFHTEMAGSPFVVLKTEGKTPGVVDINEAAQECAIYSKAWKRGIATSVFYVKPEQVTKEARAGEYVPRGAFMVYGKKSFVKDYDMHIAIGVKDGKVIGGPLTAIASKTKDYVIVGIGETKKSELAKQIKKRIGGEIDEIMNFLPGDGKIIDKL